MIFVILINFLMILGVQVGHIFDHFCEYLLGLCFFCDFYGFFGVIDRQVSDLKDFGAKMGAKMDSTFAVVRVHFSGFFVQGAHIMSRVDFWSTRARILNDFGSILDRFSTPRNPKII